MASPGIRRLMMCAIPTARVGAPPARDRMVFSPTSLAVCNRVAASTEKFSLVVMTSAAVLASVPISAAGLFIAKYTPGSSEAAAASAIMATKLSIIMPP